jgi:dTDP-4-dehydrorhamnose 3,5-epimerase
MRVIKKDIEGVVIIEPTLFEDYRGYFTESCNEAKLSEALGIDLHFIQDNESCSKSSVIRGLHFQRAPHAQSKLVRVTEGEILDVAVDLRHGSPTFGKHISVVLSKENHRQLFIPRGFAHGFSVLRGDAVVQYKCDNNYAPNAEGAIIWNDPTLEIDWKVDVNNAIVSDKDLQNRPLSECDELFDYNTNYYA